MTICTLYVGFFNVSITLLVIGITVIPFGCQVLVSVSALGLRYFRHTSTEKSRRESPYGEYNNNNNNNNNNNRVLVESSRSINALQGDT